MTVSDILLALKTGNMSLKICKCKDLQVIIKRDHGWRWGAWLIQLLPQVNTSSLPSLGPSSHPSVVCVSPWWLPHRKTRSVCLGSSSHLLLNLLSTQHSQLYLCHWPWSPSELIPLCLYSCSHQSPPKVQDSQIIPCLLLVALHPLLWSCFLIRPQHLKSFYHVLRNSSIMSSTKSSTSQRCLSTVSPPSGNWLLLRILPSPELSNVPASS